MSINVKITPRFIDSKRPPAHPLVGDRFQSTNKEQHQSDENYRYDCHCYGEIESAVWERATHYEIQSTTSRVNVYTKLKPPTATGIHTDAQHFCLPVLPVTVLGSFHMFALDDQLPLFCLSRHATVDHPQCSISVSLAHVCGDLISQSESRGPCPRRATTIHWILDSLIDDF